MTLQYKVASASLEQIYALLKECDDDYPDPLSQRVDLHEYARKLFEKAVSFEAWDEDTLVGIRNLYLNDASKQTAFATNISVLKEYRRKGIASTLLAMGLARAGDLGFRRIRGEVSRENVGAIKLYLQGGFKVIGESGDVLVVECEIVSPADASGPPTTPLIQEEG